MHRVSLTYSVRLRSLWIGSVLVAAALAAGCGSDDPTEPTGELKTAEDVTFAPELGVDLSRMTRVGLGVYWEDIEPFAHEDSAAALPFYRLATVYSGWLHDGTQIWNEVDFRFELGTGQALTGWDLGLVGLRSGGTRRLVVPPVAAYGLFTEAPVPPNSVLVFEVRLDSLQIPVQ